MEGFEEIRRGILTAMQSLRACLEEIMKAIRAIGAVIRIQFRRYVEAVRGGGVEASWRSWAQEPSAHCWTHWVRRKV